MGDQQQSRSMPSLGFNMKHAMVIGVLIMAFSIAFMMRSMPLEYGFQLNEFDPFFDFRATQFLVDNGLEAYFQWHDDMSWYPEGRNIASTSQTGLHFTAAFLYSAFASSMPLYDFVIWFPVIFGSFTAIVIFALVRVLSNTTAGLFAALFFAVSPAIIQRGNLGWFKSEPLGLFFALLSAYLLLSALNHRDMRFSIPKVVLGGILLALGLASWGGAQYLTLVFALFFLAIPFFRKDRIPLYVIPIFSIVAIATASAFPRVGGELGAEFPISLGGLALWTTGIVFVGVAYGITMKSSLRARRRNLLIWLGTFIIGGAALLGAGAYEEPSFRYVSVINPFAKSQIPLVESVAEHFTPTLVDYFANYSILILLAGYGAMLCFRKRNDMSIFALILGITAIYVSASFSRLLVYSSVGIIVLASIALFEITTAIFSRTQTVSAGPSKKKKEVKVSRAYSGKDFRIAYVAIMIAMLATPMVFPQRMSWVYAVDIPPSITNGSTSFRVVSDDWLDTLEWIRNNTPEDAVIAAWWDYGYWITTLGERTTLADNATMNGTRIAQIAKAFMSEPSRGYELLKKMQADYVLVYVVGQRSPAPDESNFVLLGGGGDESKKHWFMRIAGVNEFRYLENDGSTPTPAFWNNTLLGKMFPVQPAAYVRLNEMGGVADMQAEYRSGYTPLYQEAIKYPEESDGPLRLAYASPSFENKNERLMLAVMIYEVVGDYVPPEEPEMEEPVEMPEQPREVPTEPEPGVTEPTESNQFATLQTTYGNITIKLYPNVAPQTVFNFQSLIDQGFYDGIKFHRIIPDFVIQAGDPNTRNMDKSRWGFGGPGYNVPAEISDLKHERGVVSMAHPGDPNRAGSQFFIVVKDAPHLDGQYTIFGEVVEGMDVVDTIVSQPRDSRDIPLEDIVIEKSVIFTEE